MDNKDLQKLNYPCILHIHGDFVVALQCESDTLTYLQHGKRHTVEQTAFLPMWTGNALVVEESTEAMEPDYKAHSQKETESMVKAYSMPGLLALAAVIGMASHIENIGLFNVIRIVLNATGILVCTLLMEKQLFGKSHYGDRVCSLFHQSDCNSVLDGPMAKVFGISWSEVGLGYFMANVLLLAHWPVSVAGIVAVVNWVAMLYGVWSIYYQWRVANSRCVLCIMVQVIVWAAGLIAMAQYATQPWRLDLVNGLLTCMAFAMGIMAVHQYTTAHITDEERVQAVQQYRALKANSKVAKALIEEGEYYETSQNDSAIVFGNRAASLCVTILSNPHCNPCAKMHPQVEQLLAMGEKDICVQYIFSSFNKDLEDSARYLIACYLNHTEEEALKKYSLWYTKEKSDYKKVVAREAAHIHTEAIENELNKHKAWREKTALVATPTVLVNGYILPTQYKLEDLAMIVNPHLTKKSILHNINDRSTTSLGAESRSAEEAV